MLPSVLSDGMVLQADQPITLWGWAPVGSQVAAQIVRAADSSPAQEGSAVAGADGTWTIELAPMSASFTRYEVSISAGRDAVLQDDPRQAPAPSGPADRTPEVPGPASSSTIASAPPASPALDVAIDPEAPEARLGRIPPSFAGFSQEWWLGPLADPQVIGMFAQFAAFDTGPLILRMGGATADALGDVPGSVWDALNTLNRAVGMQFILDLNLGSDDQSLTQRQKAAALSALPAGSILSFEIGNEPNYWPGRLRPKDYLKYYPSEFKAFATALDCGSFHCTGPAWGHIFMDPRTLDWFLKTNGGLVGLTTVHFYKANNQTPNDEVTLLDEAALQKAMTSLRAQVEVSSQHGVPLRVDESNAISGGGLDGVSNVFSAALWLLDSAFEIAAAGVVGVNFHEGSPLYAFYEERTTTTGTAVGGPKASAIYAQPAFHGTLFFQQAVQGSGQQETRLLARKIDGAGAIKVWPLVQGNEVRVVVINKDPKQAYDVRVRLNPAAYGDGTLTRLLAPSLAARRGITIAGVSYDDPGAQPSGKPRPEQVQVIHDGIASRYAIAMPPGSAALLVVRRRAVRLGLNNSLDNRFARQRGPTASSAQGCRSHRLSAPRGARPRMKQRSSRAAQDAPRAGTSSRGPR